MPAPERHHYSRIPTRRQFLGLGVNVAALGAYKVTEPALNQLEDWLGADVNNEEFIDRNKKKLQFVSIGTTFCPERFGVHNRNYERETSLYQKTQVALRVATEDLGMRDIRFGIRWETAEPENGEINLKFYDPYLQSMISDETKICLTVGSKAPGYPEQHYPDFIKKDKNFIPKGSALSAYNWLGERSLEYIDNLTSELLRQYGRTAFDTFQIENEPFQLSGNYQHHFDEEYMLGAIQTVHDKFPEAKILINTSHISEISKIQAFANDVVKQDPDLWGRLIIGDDFYFQQPGKAILDEIPLIKHLDPIALINIWKFGNVMEENHAVSEQQNIGTEVTEGQSEVWGKYVFPLKPKALRFLVKRSIDEILDLDYVKKRGKIAVIRTWGFEQEAMRTFKDFSADSQERFELIQMINNLSLQNSLSSR